MNNDHLKHLLGQVRNGQLSIEDAFDNLRKLPFDDLRFARTDGHHCIRKDVQEVIFCQGKNLWQIQEIVERVAHDHTNILATKADSHVFKGIQDVVSNCRYHETARVVVINPMDAEKIGNIAVITAGTSDIPVAEEATVTAQTLGNRVSRIYDVGVAGVHRLLHWCDDLFQANVVVVVAGMEGALASVVGGLVSAPVIGVPTSVGYGASFGGIAALLSMLNSCASGVSVVNIDNGFGAGYQANLINKVASDIKDRVSQESPQEECECVTNNVSV